MEIVVNISDFKARCIALLKGVHQTGSTLVVTHRGKPLARVESAQFKRPKRQFGGGRGTARILGEIVTTDGSADWDWDQHNLGK